MFVREQNRDGVVFGEEGEAHSRTLEQRDLTLWAAAPDRSSLHIIIHRAAAHMHLEQNLLKKPQLPHLLFPEF